MPLEGRNPPHHQNPSFSSTLLDKIYRDDDGGGRVANVVASVPGMRQVCSEGVVSSSSIKEMCIENRVAGWTAVYTEMRPRDCDVDHDVAYFSSTSISSDSSSGGFSSSDTDAFHGAKMKASCFVPLKLRPVKTHAAPAKTEKAENGGGGAVFFRNRADGIESKSKALKAHETLRKVKQQPVSPGTRLTSLLNSIFTSSRKKKGRSHDDVSLKRKPKSGHGSTCSSATSFTRACLNNGYSSRSAIVSLRDEPRDVGTRSVRFCPVDVVVGEDCPRWPRTSRHDKNVGVSKSGRGDEKRTWMQEIRRLEDIKSKTDEIRKGEDRAKFCSHDEEYDNDDDDGAGSCSSSDLFEIDHLAMIGYDHDNNLPV